MQAIKILMSNVGRTERIPALDGLRAVSILLVIIWHFQVIFHLDKAIPFLWRFDPGPTGVSIFFVISGYLITTILLKEQNAYGSIRLSGFYFRRFFRIVPAYLFLIAVIALLKASDLIHVEWWHFIPALLYLTNYIDVDWVLLHSWSLAVEEQFYLLYPIILVRFNRRVVISILLSMLGIAVAARLLAEVMDIWPFTARYSFEGRVDQLAFGCLCAYVQNSNWKTLSTFLDKYSFYLFGISFIIAITLPPGNTRILLFNTLVGGTTALLIYTCTTRTDFWMTRLLDFKPLRIIGILSYSLYLWQQVWLAPELSLSISSALIGTAFSAVFSYWFVEQSGFRIRRYLEGCRERPAAWSHR